MLDCEEAPMISARNWIQHLRDHARLARAGTDPEGVHQVRVAAGRLSVWLEMSGRRMLRDDLAWLRSSASALRDLDVIDERLATYVRGASELGPSTAEIPGSPSPGELLDWRERLRDEREAARRNALRALSSARFGALLAALSFVPDVDEKTARASLSRFRARIERAALKLERAPEKIETLHRLRRAVRRMRYALEWLGDDPRALKELQEELGELNNGVMLLQHLEHAALAAQEGRNAPNESNAQHSPAAPHSPAAQPSPAAQHSPGADPSLGARQPPGEQHPPEPHTGAINGAAARFAQAIASTDLESHFDRAALNGSAPLHRRVEIEIARRRAKFFADWSRARAAFDHG